MFGPKYLQHLHAERAQPVNFANISNYDEQLNWRKEQAVLLRYAFNLLDIPIANPLYKVEEINILF